MADPWLLSGHEVLRHACEHFCRCLLDPGGKFEGFQGHADGHLEGEMAAEVLSEVGTKNTIVLIHP